MTALKKILPDSLSGGVGTSPPAGAGGFPARTKRRRAAGMFLCAGGLTDEEGVS